VKPALVRFYFDADVLGLGKIIASLRPDCTFPGDPGTRLNGRDRPPCQVTDTAVLDTIWIPVVAKAGLAIITRDSAIQRSRELRAVRDARAKMFALSPRDATTKWAQLELLMTRWRDIERKSFDSGPFIVPVSRTGKMRPIDLT